MRRCSESAETETEPLMGGEMQDENADRLSDKMFSKSMFHVIIAFFFVWIPIMIVDCLYTALNDKCNMKKVDLINTFLPLNCFLNPIFYLHGNREVAEYLNDLWKRLCCKCCITSFAERI